MKLDDARSDFVERVGRYWETVSGTRAAGRILGWLMICEPDHQSAAELSTILRLSTGSVSTQIRLLEQIGLVERLTFSGDRASYYRLLQHVWTRTMNSELARVTEMRKMAESGRDILPTLRPDRVTELGKIAGFFEQEWPQLMVRLNQHLAEDQSE